MNELINSKIKSLIVVSLLLFATAVSAQVPDTSYLRPVRHELKKVWPKNRLINVVFHGHSGPAGYWHDHEVHTLESYPNLVLKKLKQQYPYAVINVIVTAIGGENSIKGATRFENEVLVHQPDVLLIDYAANDRFQGLEKPKKAWEKMIVAAKAKNIKIILITPSPDQRLDIQKSTDLDLHAQQIRDLAAKYQVGLADPYSVFKKIGLEKGSIAEYMSHVNHCNEKGHEIVATEIFKWF